ncbi:helix-turn-helix domain-containing protein [Citricoccus alkalitolerans]|uniref:Helix-turn-helix domain-containing protein n=1 Tax=Citricoccus alkalitolerans TaxID=246603 RepID=A0ABV8Y125_9MICC
MPSSVQLATGLEQQLTIKEVAEITGTSTQTVRRWIQRGELRAYFYGARALRIDPADLRKMRREVNPATYSVVGGGAA